MFIKVRVTADAKRESIIELAEHHLAISVKEPAAENRANKRVLEMVAQHLRLTAKALHIKSGHHSPSKLIEVRI